MGHRLRTQPFLEWQGQHSAGANDVRRDGDHFECTLCGAILDDVNEGTVIRTMVVGSSGQPNVRVILVDRQEIHRCDVPRHR